MCEKIQNPEQKIGVNAMNSILERANLRSASGVETRLFTPHVSNGNERVRANHQNYSRS
ncbi:MAG: hypothetical protein HXX16_01790 [Bacteroidales bacterium]|nr:hypothetical protein [Bacteroidales bacterium]